MAAPAPQLQLYSSPKRKRGAVEPVRYSPVVSPSLTRIVTDLKEYPFLKNKDANELPNAISPRSKVAGQLQNLDLQDSETRSRSPQRGGNARKRLAQMKREEGYEVGQRMEDETQRHSTLSPNLLAEKNRDPTIPPPSSAFDFRLPEPFSAISERPQVYRRSPSLDGDPDDNPLTWHDSEITGHDPTDPSDDGYGINGIGFKPTPAIAWARQQKRKQQLTEYKNREAREARQRRSERRRVNDTEMQIDGNQVDEERKTLRVRFADG